MMSLGMTLTIIPNETRPLPVMPRPQVATFDPEAERPITVSLTPRRFDPDDDIIPTPLWGLGLRFRLGWVF